jgi:hypothetical protein
LFRSPLGRFLCSSPVRRRHDHGGFLVFRAVSLRFC